MKVFVAEKEFVLTVEEAQALEMLVQRAYVTKFDRPEVLEVGVELSKKLRAATVPQLENPAFMDRKWLASGSGLALFSDWMRYVAYFPISELKAVVS